MAVVHSGRFMAAEAEGEVGEAEYEAAAADILSGIRFQCSSSNDGGNIHIIHNMDHILLSNSTHSIVSPDVILQVHNEVYFQLALQKTLTEPFIASFITSSLPPNSALFLGNSMPIREVDMYAGLQQMCSKSPVARGRECLPGVGNTCCCEQGSKWNR